MQISWNILSKYRNELMGISILWIIAFHLVELKHNKLPNIINDLYGLLFHGYLGVEIFLLLSGMGLYYSYKNNRDVSNFYRKRLKRLMVPYFVISGLFFGFHDLVVANNILLFLKDISMYSFWSAGNRTVWFIALIIPLYIFYPIIFKIIDSKGFVKKTFSLIIIIYLLVALLKIFDYRTFVEIEIALTRVPAFLLGGVLGRLAYENMVVSSWVKIILFLFIFFGLYAFNHKNFPVVNWKFLRGIFFLLSTGFAFYFAILLEILNNSKLNNFFANIGKISLEIYLVHVAVLHTLIKTQFYKTTDNGLYCSFIIVCIGSIFISFVLNKYISPYIYAIIERK